MQTRSHAWHAVACIGVLALSASCGRSALHVHNRSAAVVDAHGADAGAAGGPSTDGVSPTEVDAPAPVGSLASVDCAPAPTPTPLQRLTRLQYHNAVRDLLRLETLPALDLPVDEKAGPFFVNTTGHTGELAVLQYQAAAEALAAAAGATDKLAALLACPANAVDTACAAAFVRGFGLRVFRRPLRDEEAARYTALAGKGAAGGTAGVQLVVEAMLQSPHFLYRPEIGAESVDGAVLTAWELASRLAFTLWQTTPDDELLAAAGAGELASSAQVEAAARRLMASPRFAANGAAFVMQWLGVTGLDDVTKDAATYPGFTPALRAAMMQEVVDFTAYVFRNDAKLGTLLTAPFSLLSEPLFAHYGIAKPDGWQPGTPVALPAQRAGLLTQAGFLTAHAHANGTSVVGRGKVVRESLFCQAMPPPPPDIPVLPPAVPGAQTAREIFARHEASPACAGCHIPIDSFGLALEHYDGTGAWRDSDHGLVIDPAGVFSGRTQRGVAFTDAVDLAGKLAASPDVQSCAALQMYRFALQRPTSAADNCAVGRLASGLGVTGQDLRALLLTLVTADYYRVLRKGEAP